MFKFEPCLLEGSRVIDYEQNWLKIVGKIIGAHCKIHQDVNGAY